MSGQFTAISGTVIAETADGRRLVVIDPEDREQIERLCAAVAEQSNRVDDYLDVLQAALRSLVSPPRPVEPTGLGAVVEDEDGERWLRFESRNGGWWRDVDGHNRRWSDLAAVKVLSEGVTQ